MRDRRRRTRWTASSSSTAIRQALRKPGVSEDLTKQGFAVVPSDLRLFQNAYEGNVYDGWPVFVTTDVAYHEWHQVFDKILRDVEQKVLLPKLRDTRPRPHARCPRAGRARRADREWRTRRRASSSSSRSRRPSSASPSPSGRSRRRRRLSSTRTTRREASPIVGAKIDYSLFTPRGHYTRNAALTRYFKAMSVLGQSAFCLPGTKDCPGLEPARIGILASRVLVEDPDLVGLWRDLYEPTAFLVGLADDYTPLEVAAAAQKAVPNGLEDATAFADDATVEDVLGRLAASRPVRINPERAAIRLMGTRFVIDSFILDQLIAPNVTGGGSSRPPSTWPPPSDPGSPTEC